MRLCRDTSHPPNQPLEASGIDSAHIFDVVDQLQLPHLIGIVLIVLLVGGSGSLEEYESVGCIIPSKG